MLTEEERKRRNAERTKRWREANPARARAGVKAWCERFPDRKAASDRAYREANLEKIAAQQKVRREADPDGYRAYWRTYHADHKEKRREQRLLRVYGLPLGGYGVILAAQGGRCATCSATKPGGAGKYFHVDHDHETGKVRGLLCHECNTALRDTERMRKLLNYMDNPTIR